MASKRKKYEYVKLDLPVEVSDRLDRIAKMCSLTASKVANVLIALRLDVEKTAEKTKKATKKPKRRSKRFNRH